MGSNWESSASETTDSKSASEELAETNSEDADSSAPVATALKAVAFSAICVYQIL